jgi:hypothetical protein
MSWIKQIFSRRRKDNLAVSPVALPDCGFGYSKPVLHGVPLLVVPTSKYFCGQ